MVRDKKIIILGILAIILLIGFWRIWNPFFGFYGTEPTIEIEHPCAVCINGCDTCPEGCDECLIGIEKKLKDPNMKWYYSIEGSQKFNEMTIPVFADNKPETVINSLLQALNVSSLDIKFSDPAKSSQWWISDDGWNINDPNAISIASPSVPGGGHRLSVDPLSPKTRELKYFISRIFLANDFAFNATNTSMPETENDFYDYIVAFQRDETRCTLKTDGDSGQYTIACSNRFQEAYEEQIPYLRALDNRNVIVSVRERIGDFVWLSVHLRRTGYVALIKDSGGKMEVIFTGQEEPSCDLMLENQVPKEVYGACYDASGNIVE